MNELFEPYHKSQLMIEALNKQNKKGEKSPKTTDILNQEVVNILKKYINKTYVCVPEKRIRCSRGDNFKVDIAILDAQQSLAGVVLLKAVRSSYNKNRHNYTNTICGETSRLFDFPDGIRENFHVLFIDWIPRQVPVRDKNGKIKNIEKTKIPNVQPFIDNQNKLLEGKNSSLTYEKIIFDSAQCPSNLIGGEAVNEFCRRFK